MRTAPSRLARPIAATFATIGSRIAAPSVTIEKRRPPCAAARNAASPSPTTGIEAERLRRRQAGIAESARRSRRRRPRASPRSAATARPRALRCRRGVSMAARPEVALTAMISNSSPATRRASLASQRVTLALVLGLTISSRGARRSFRVRRARQPMARDVVAPRDPDAALAPASRRGCARARRCVQAARSCAGAGRSTSSWAPARPRDAASRRRRARNRRSRRRAAKAVGVLELHVVGVEGVRHARHDGVRRTSSA